MFRTMTIAALLLLALPVAQAQPVGPTGTTVFNVSLETTYFDDCDPGTACFVVWCGTVEGTLTLEYDGFDGIYDNYIVTDIDWVLHRVVCGGTGPFDDAITGSGTFQVDRAVTPSQAMTLDLSIAGFPVTVSSGLVTPAESFPIFDDFALISVSTAISFNLFMEPVPEDSFRRGDANDDGVFDIADPVLTLSMLFVMGTPAVECLNAVDSNDDGAFDISDAIYSLSALFTSGPVPPAPFPDCGEDPTADGLDCGSFASCP